MGDRLRVPGLVLVIGLGMAIGSDGLNWLPFDDYELAKTIGVVALAAILFEGGLAAGFPEIRPVLRPALSMALVGTTLTAVFAGLAASWLLHFSLLEGLLLGSILAATDGAAIFAVLRGSTLRRRVARTLEGEAGLERPRRRPARDRLQRLDHDRRLQPARHGPGLRGRAVGRRGRGPRGRRRRRRAACVASR